MTEISGILFLLFLAFFTCLGQVLENKYKIKKSFGNCLLVGSSLSIISVLIFDFSSLKEHQNFFITFLLFSIFTFLLIGSPNLLEKTIKK